jgi:hypothetical protein
VYKNNILETTLTQTYTAFGAYVAIGGPNDDLIAVSGVGEFYFYYFSTSNTWNFYGVITTHQFLDPDGDFGPSLWMPSIGAVNTIVIGPYGYTSEPGGPNPSVGVFNWAGDDINFVNTITPDGDPDRYTVAISGDENTVAIGSVYIGVLSIYNLNNTITPALRYSTTTVDGSYYHVSINYDGTLVLLTMASGGTKQVLMFSLD